VYNGVAVVKSMQFILDEKSFIKLKFYYNSYPSGLCTRVNFVEAVSRVGRKVVSEPPLSSVRDALEYLDATEPTEHVHDLEGVAELLVQPHNHGHLYVDRQWLVVQHELHRGRLEWRLLDEEGVSHWLENLETQRK
jgi:hypothetical protein